MSTPATKEQILAIIAAHPAQLDYHDIWERCGADNGRHNDDGVLHALLELIDEDVIFQPCPSVYWDLATHRVWHEWLDMWRELGSFVAWSTP